MAVNLSEFIEQLQRIEEAHGGDLMVVTDMDQGVEGAEYNEDGGAAAVIVTES